MQSLSWKKASDFFRRNNDRVDGNTSSVVSNDPKKIIIVIDEPTTDGRLGFDRYSKNLANVIKNTSPKFSVGIFGGWGTGKTTLMRMIRKELNTNEKILTVWFDPWRYEYEQYLAVIPLLRTIRLELEAFIKKYDLRNHKGWSNVRNGLDRTFTAFVNSTKVTYGVKVVSAETNLGDFVNSLKGNNSWLGGITDNTIYYHATDHLKQALDSLRNNNNFDDQEFRIVVFIDDLDRCTPKNGLQVIESIKGFFDIEGIIYVIGMNYNTINEIIKTKYGKGNPTIGGFEYMQKIVQLPFEIPPWKGDDISASVEQIIENELKGSEVLNEFKNNGKLIVKAVESNPRQLKRFINNVILAKAVSNELPIDGLIAVRALDFRREWNRFSELMTPDETRTMFLSEYKTLKEKGITITNEEQLDKIAKGTSDSLLQDEDILEIYRELVKQGKALRDFLDSTSEVWKKIEKMGDFRRALDTTKLKPIEEQLEFYERLLKYLNKTQSLYSRSIEERRKLVQLAQQNHPKECSQIDSYNPDFAPIYRSMNNEELSMFNSLRQITQDISTYDSIMLMLLDKKSIYLETIPVLRDLYDHLDSWLKQYKEIFHRPEVSLIYEYDKPFPATVKELVEEKIQDLKLQI